MIKTWIEKLKALRIYAVSDSIWILYRIERGEIKTFGHYNDYNRAKKWADAGGYKILESKSF
jgi:hypothetical protein